MPSFTDVFSDNLVPSSGESYAVHNLTDNSTFQWRYNYSGDGNVLASINEVDCSNGVVMTMPPASEVSKGESVIFKNTGSFALTLVKSDLSALAVVDAGEAVFLVIKDNTGPGVWDVTVYGTGASSADAMSLAGNGLVAIGSVLNAAFESSVESSSWSIDSNDRAKVFIYVGGTASCTLPAVSTVGDDFFVLLRNSGTGSLTVTPDGTETINGSSSLALNPSDSAILVTDGSDWHTVGYGRSLLYQFTQLVYTAVAGSQTLTSTQASNKLLTFIGSPAAAVTIVVPSVVAIYYVHNNLSTPENVTIKTASGLGALVTNGNRAILFCDGTDVLSAQTAEITGDISISDGSAVSPGISFTSDTTSGIFKKGINGIGFSVDATEAGYFSEDGFTVSKGYLGIPTNATPSQIEEGAAVWDNDSDLLTIGTGSGRKTLIDTDSSQTLTNKTLTSPTITSPTLTVKSGTGVTTEGVVEWDTSADLLKIGTGSATKTMVDTDSAQTLSNKTIKGLVAGITNLAVNTVLTSNAAYSYSASGLTLTLPASPSNGDTITVINTGSDTNCVIDRNGSTIMGLSENMTIDKASVSVTLKSNGSDWRII